jgi:hypothetical protein
MRVAIATAAVVASAAIFSACSEETTGSSTVSDGVSSGTEAGSPADATTSSGQRAPTGCVLETTGFMVGAKAESAPRADVPNAASWNDVDGALASDGKFATVTLAEGQESSRLRVSGFGFAIPDSAETWGIEVELKRRALDGGVEDHRIDLEIEGKPTRFKYMNGPWPTSIVGTHAYGQAIDTWGVDLLPADVKKPTFAATLTVKRGSNATGPVTAIVDSLKVAVHFCRVPIEK